MNIARHFRKHQKCSSYSWIHCKNPWFLCFSDFRFSTPWCCSPSHYWVAVIILLLQNRTDIQRKECQTQNRARGEGHSKRKGRRRLLLWRLCWHAIRTNGGNQSKATPFCATTEEIDQGSSLQCNSSVHRSNAIHVVPCKAWWTTRQNLNHFTGLPPFSPGRDFDTPPGLLTPPLSLFICQQTLMAPSTVVPTHLPLAKMAHHPLLYLKTAILPFQQHTMITTENNIFGH